MTLRLVSIWSIDWYICTFIYFRWTTLMTVIIQQLFAEGEVPWSRSWRRRRRERAVRRRGPGQRRSEYCWVFRLGKYSPIFTEPEANNCFSIITQVNIRENQRIDCQTFLFTLFPEVVRQWTATRADHMILQIDFTDKKWQTCARTNILYPSENKTGENLPNKKLICFQFKQKS